jgi:succinyl-CoA synthetase beta subunit
MNIHEHQAKAVLSEFGVAVPRGYPAFTVEEAVKAAEQLGGPVFVVKSQIHAGGRGKGRFEGLGPEAKGGVRVLKSLDDVKASAQEMLGSSPSRPARRASRSTASTSRKAPPSPRNSTSRCWWTAKPAACPWSPPPRAA